MVKESVHAALQRFVPVLRQRDADVRVIYLPAGSGGAKVGLDDFFAAGGTVDELLSHARTELRELPARHSESVYEVSDDGLVWNRTDHGRPVVIPLTNFQAEIVADVERDTGAERQRFFDIEADVGGQRSAFRIAASEYDSMRWVTEKVGARAVIAPGQTIREHARVAIQLNSDPELRRSYGHLGWREIDGHWDIYSLSRRSATAA
jgi:hypothetical protein